MVVMALLSLIVIALMGVFSSTQSAFRASVTQTDVLEGGRAAMDLISTDLRAMAPSGGTNYVVVNNVFYLGPVNFAVSVKKTTSPQLIQSLTPIGPSRTNVLEDFFILSRENRTWTGVGYVVDTSSTNSVNPLYRFSMSTNVAATSPLTLYNLFVSEVNNGAFTNMSHLMDGVIGLRIRAYDLNGIWLTNGYALRTIPEIKNTFFEPPIPPVNGEVGMYMFSNTLPASVEIEMATLEDRVLQRAESRPNYLPAPPPNDARTIYLQTQAGTVHIFRQRVAIPMVDPAAYQ